MIRALASAALALALQGCFSARYVAQAARGQLGILREARPLPDAVVDRALPDRTRRLLLAVPAVKAFGEEQGLRPTRSYGTFAELRRPAAVWVVQACAPLSFDVRTWSFPVVGSLPYLGWFDLAAARRHAARLEERGLDVWVRGAEAYSTLGWFPDPVLSTMIGAGDEALGDLANVVLHESVHATVYVRGQSVLDESLATFVADRLTPAWLDRAAGAGSVEARAWREARARRRARAERLHRAWAELDRLYRSGASDEEKRAGKARILGEASAELRARVPYNNAALAGLRTYESGAAALERLLAACGGSFPRLLAAVGALRPEDFSSPQQRDVEPVIDRLARAGCRRPPR